MADAKCCDRCGVFYKKNNTYVKLYEIYTVGSNREMDLCDECHEKLNTFMKEYKSIRLNEEETK